MGHGFSPFSDIGATNPGGPVVVLKDDEIISINPSEVVMLCSKVNSPIDDIHCLFLIVF